ncbi:MAG: hypothetical protein ACK5P5_14210, partial [Pseudobdellovibrionaceae bacterium]
ALPFRLMICGQSLVGALASNSQNKTDCPHLSVDTSSPKILRVDKAKFVKCRFPAKDLNSVGMDFPTPLSQTRKNC